ncbi:MAG: hypothetical protein PHS92_04245 [Candidatus Gracilibacteria bacterium]|nr:hypothetical protein [Candidatus Gracilibacteria bacterium]
MKLKKIVSILAVIAIILGFLVPMFSVFFTGTDNGISYNNMLNLI